MASDDGVELVGTAANVEDVVALCTTVNPDVVLMDVKMPGGGGAKATRLIRQQHPQMRVVAFSAYQDRATILEMLGAGATGYVTKGSPAAEVLTAIRGAVQGVPFVSMGVSKELVHELGERMRTEQDWERARESRVARIAAALARPVPMVFQPIVDLAVGRIEGVEALARFPGDPRQPPDAWFADAAGLDLSFGLERAAVLAAVARLDELPADVFLAVNASPDVIVAPGFWDGIAGPVLSRLVIEVTEHAPVQSYDHLREALRPLREQGAKLAVDDAGAGFASLRHIVLLDADFIKLDISLTRDLHIHTAARAMASALISFAAETGAAVIAEGIEHEAEREALLQLGAMFGQGYLLAKPAELEALDFTVRGNRLTPRGTSVSEDEAARRESARVVDRLRRKLLRVATPDEAVALLVGLVHDLGGRTQPASLQGDDVLPVDLSLGVLPEPILAAAAAGTRARLALERYLPGCVEDVRAVVSRLSVGVRSAHEASMDPLTGLLNRRATEPALRGARVGDAVAMSTWITSSRSTTPMDTMPVTPCFGPSLRPSEGRRGRMTRLDATAARSSCS